MGQSPKTDRAGERASFAGAVGGRGARRLRRRAAIAGAMATALLGSVTASASAQSFDQPEGVLASTSGNDSELIKAVNIGTAPGPGTVAMSLPVEGQPFESGDGLSAGSELEVTTDCSSQGNKCVGDPYSYGPRVDARLILTSLGDPRGSAGTAVTLAQETGRKCTQQQHHCVIVFPFPDSPLALSPPACTFADGGCLLNLVVDAYSPRAQPGNVLIVGEDEPDCCGITVQDKGRVNALRLRPVVPGSEPSTGVSTESSGPLISSVPVRDKPSQAKTVVFSQPVEALEQGEQLTVSADMTSEISGLPYNRVLVQSRLILTSRPGATSPTRKVKRVEELKGEISEANGFNCTQGVKYIAEVVGGWDRAAALPCETRKVGVARLTRTADDPLYVNLVISSTPARSGAAQAGDSLIVTGGTLRVARYPASRYG
jgi:hypothetical protein